MFGRGVGGGWSRGGWRGGGGGGGLRGGAGSVELEHLLGEIDVAAEHHRLELDEIVDGEDGVEDEIVELAAGAVGHHLDEAGGGDAHLDEELAQQGLDEALEIGVDGRVLQLVLILVVEHSAVVVDETHQRVRVHGALREEKDAGRGSGRGRDARRVVRPSDESAPSRRRVTRHA